MFLNYNLIINIFYLIIFFDIKKVFVSLGKKHPNNVITHDKIGDTVTSQDLHTRRNIFNCLFILIFIYFDFIYVQLKIILVNVLIFFLVYSSITTHDLKIH